MGEFNLIFAPFYWKAHVEETTDIINSCMGKIEDNVRKAPVAIPPGWECTIHSSFRSNDPSMKLDDQYLLSVYSKYITNFLYEYIPVSERDSRILNLFKNNYYESDEETLQEGKKKAGTKLCARGKSAAKSKFKVYPSAYANGYAVQVCKGKIKGLDGKKQCSGAYC